VKQGEQGSTYEEFLTYLPNDECRFAIYDFKMDSHLPQAKRLCFIIWAPESAPIRFKMVYSYLKQNVARAFEGIQVSLESTHLSDLDSNYILNICKSSMTAI